MYAFSVKSFVRSRGFYTFLSFFITAFLVMLLAPRSHSFPYEFQSGKPWAYELLTAPYDFPIYKSDEQLQMEQDSIRQATPPVFTLENDELARQLNLLQANFEKELSATIPPTYYHFLKQELRTYYSEGIIQGETLSKLKQQGFLEINILGEDNVLTRKATIRLQSLKEVYDRIFEDAAREGLQREILMKFNVASYLVDNIRPNPEYSEKILADALGALSASTGIIQQGERIIDRGEIITPYTYNVLRSLRIEQIKRTGGETLSIFNGGVLLYTFLLFALLATYLLLFCRPFLEESKNLLLLQVLFFAFLAMTELQAATGVFPVQVIPYVVVLLLLRIFFGSHLAMNAYLVLIQAAAYFHPTEALSFIFIQISAGFAALFSLQSLASRAQIIRTAFIVYLVYIGASMIDEWIREGAITAGYWIQLLYYGVNLIFLMFSYILAFIVERIFGYVSNIRLVELSDMNRPLLQHLSEIAPGTFQHSYQVSILATAAATKVHADAQLIRTGALYHDIGKMLHPEYFTENSPTGNPHQGLSYQDSASIIIRHVADGVTLAQKHGLPDSVIEFIRTHHGRSTTRYFYNSYCNEHPGEDVDPEPFTYPGPNPYTKEQGILMLADSVEAASRSLSEYSEATIRALIDKLVDGIVAEGLLNDTPLTFHDIKEIKEVFYTKLKTIYHARIAYPDKK